VVAMTARVALLAISVAACWTTPDPPVCTPARALNVINSDNVEVGPWMSNDRLDLLWTHDGTDGYRIYHAERTSLVSDFGNVEELDAPTSVVDSMFDPWLSPDKQVLRFLYGDGNTGGQIFEAKRDETAAGRYATRMAPKVFTNVAPPPGVLRPTFTDDDLEMVYVIPATGGPDFGDLAIVRRETATNEFQLPPHILGLTTTTETENGAMILGDGQTLVYHVGDHRNANDEPKIYRAEREGDDFIHGARVDELFDQAGDDDEHPYLAPDRKTWLFSRDIHDPSGTTNDDIWTYCE
jgi:hypothetical protein